MCEIVSAVKLVFDHVLDDLHLNFHVRRNIGGVSDHVDAKVVDSWETDFLEFVLEGFYALMHFEFVLSLLERRTKDKKQGENVRK